MFYCFFDIGFNFKSSFGSVVKINKILEVVLLNFEKNFKNSKNITEIIIKSIEKQSKI